MVLALLLAPHARRLKTLAGMILGYREHVATISRRLRNAKWKTRDWYAALYCRVRLAYDNWERRQAGGKKRRWFAIIDTTYHATHSEDMENLILMSRRRRGNQRQTRQRAYSQLCCSAHVGEALTIGDYAEILDGVRPQHDQQGPAVLAERVALGNGVPWPPIPGNLPRISFAEMPERPVEPL
jgi:hypothetical protein